MVSRLALWLTAFALWGGVPLQESDVWVKLREGEALAAAEQTEESQTEIFIHSETMVKEQEGSEKEETRREEERSGGGEEQARREEARVGGEEERFGREEARAGGEEQTRKKIGDPEDGAGHGRSAQPKRVTLSFAGDISFAEGYANMVSYHSRGNDIAQCITPDLIARMDSADIMMVNNEFTYSNRGAPLSGKTFTFRAKPEMAENLLKLSVDIVSLANNHVFDYGEIALIDTLDTLDRYEIPYVGAGRNLEEAKKIVYMERGGMKIAFVSATQVERSYVFTKEATNSSAGVLRTFSPETFLEVIRRAEETSDFVVVYVHWGTEGVNQFEGDQQLLGHQYIDAGADLVIGDHPHCLQGVEYYKGVPIFYSLGNYWFNSRTLDTGLVEADICRDGLLELRFVPCLQQNCRTSLVTDPAQQQRMFRFLESISAIASVDELGVIREK